MFEKGYTPWNKGKEFRSKASFVKGQVPWNLGSGNAPKDRFRRAKYYCGKRNKSWETTLDEYTILTSNSCHYCGSGLPKYGVGLDRKDNAVGYVLSNVVPCCSTCNDTKGAHITYDEMMVLMQYRENKKKNKS